MPDTPIEGQIIAHFRILSRIGAGGMGEVYLAEDVRLGRKIALKVLTPARVTSEDRVRRFTQEARAASALNHPNILTIHDIGEAGAIRYIATEFIDGETLRARLIRGAFDLASVLEIGAQIASALAAAHDAGIVHRDIKPENVMLRRDGYVKVLDFGLAKLMEPDPPALDSDGLTRTLLETNPGLVLGTFSYMSPEQARGQEVDARSDLFSLGVVLYEMIAGVLPFTGSTAADVLGAILYVEPVPLADSAVPDGLARLVERTLRKRKEERYRSMHEVVADLKAVRRQVEITASAAASGQEQDPGVQIRGPAHETRAPGEGAASWRDSSAGRSSPPPRRRRRRTIDSLAVLPLVNASLNAEAEYLGDGITETIINNLSQVPKLRVMARSTVFRYKGPEVDPLTVGRSLNVRAILTGRLLQRGGNLVIAAELVDVEDGSQLWSGQFSRQAARVFELQDEISAEILERLRLRLAGEVKKRLARAYAPQAEAYQAYLKGRFFLNKRTAAGFAKAIEHFEDAIRKDARYALAHAGLADAYALDAATSYATVALRDAVDKARAAARRALELDTGLAEAHAAMALVKTRFDWDWEGAETAYKRAIELNPGYAPAHHGYGMLLGTRGRFDEALGEMRRAQELDPLSLVVGCGLGRVLHFARRFNEAIAQYRRVLEMDPQYARVRFDLGLSLAAREAHDEAIGELQKAGELSGSRTWAMLLMALGLGLAGRVEEARASLSELEVHYQEGKVGPGELASVYAVVGDSDRATELLESACAVRSGLLTYAGVDPVLESMRADPRCRAVLERAGLLLSAEAR